MSRLLCTKREFLGTLSINMMAELFWEDWPEDAEIQAAEWREEIAEFLTDAINIGILQGFTDEKTKAFNTMKISPKSAVEAMRLNPAYAHLLPPSLLAALSEPATSAETKIADGISCRDWLAELMQVGPPQKAKAEYRSKGMARFNISARAFDRSWTDAAQIVGPKLGGAWTKSGRRKSRQF